MTKEIMDKKLTNLVKKLNKIQLAEGNLMTVDPSVLWEKRFNCLTRGD